ncbi:MAG: bifunctional riboflavin kinase/FAD synthetase [Candidatus Sericytochromatia bacterium]
MKVFFDIPEIDEDTTIAIGTFDGVHKGHLEVLNKAKNIAKENNQKFLVFTFIDHPSIVTGSKKVPFLLNTSEEKISNLKKIGVDYCVIPPFSKGLSMLYPEEFIKEILVGKLKAKNICVGFNFFFGYKAEGDGKLIKELSSKYNYSAYILDSLVLDNETVSSSTIRNLILNGEIEKANFLLGYEYFLKGNVIKGQGLGKSVLGIPTANLAVNGRKLVPKISVYSCSIRIRNKEYNGVVNIGKRPTFDNGLRSIEAHILNFDDDIYDEQIEISLKTRIRDEKKFDSFEELKNQIHKDIEDSRKLFK